ncbi:YcxB family protein [Bacillus velezensis]|uniref:YcxB family protein n=1 Tax=Bacillus velezensis TaxID=492670 RepID=UPI0033992ADB
MINTRNENIYLAGCLTFADVRKHFAYHQGKSAAVCFLIMLLASAICFEMNGPVTGGTWGVRALLNFLAAVILSLAVTVIATAISFFRLYRTYKTNPRLKSARSITIHQLGISQKQKNASTLFEWDELLSAREHKDMFRLQTSGYGTLLLPKRLFYSQKDIAVFRQMLRENVNGKVNVTE